MAVLLLEVGLDAGAHGLHDQAVLFAIDSGKPLGPEYRLMQGDFTHGGFYLRRILRLLSVQHE